MSILRAIAEEIGAELKEYNNKAVLTCEPCQATVYNLNKGYAVYIGCEDQLVSEVPTIINEPLTLVRFLTTSLSRVGAKIIKLEESFHRINQRTREAEDWEEVEKLIDGALDQVSSIITHHKQRALTKIQLRKVQELRYMLYEALHETKCKQEQQMNLIPKVKLYPPGSEITITSE